MVDGGTDYLRYGGANMDLVEPRTIYSDEPFENVRDFIFWGTRGKNGDKPLKQVSISQMSDDHIKALLDYIPASHVYVSYLLKEQEYRKVNNILIKDYE